MGFPREFESVFTASSSVWRQKNERRPKICRQINASVNMLGKYALGCIARALCPVCLVWRVINRFSSYAIQWYTMWCSATVLILLAVAISGVHYRGCSSSFSWSSLSSACVATQKFYCESSVTTLFCWPIVPRHCPDDTTHRAWGHHLPASD